MTSIQNNWKELKDDLNISSQNMPTTDHRPDAEYTQLEQEILELWHQNDATGKKLGPLLFRLCQTLNAQGKKGAGFRAWLKAHQKPKSSAYRWIKEYAHREGLKLPFPEKTKHTSAKSTSSQMGQGSSTITLDVEAPYVPPPATISEAVALLNRFIQKLPSEQRLGAAKKLREWLENLIAELTSGAPGSDHATE